MEDPFEAAARGDVEALRRVRWAPGGGGGVDPDARGPGGWTALQRAVVGGRPGAARVLLREAGARADGVAAGEAAVAALSEAQVEELFPGGRYRNRVAFGSSPLYLACLLGGAARLEAAVLLLDAGAPAAALEASGGSPLHAAAFGDNVPALRELAARGASASTPDDNGAQPLLSAAFAGAERAVRYLIEEAGCDPLAARRDGWNAMFSASVGGHPRLVVGLAREYGLPPGAVPEPAAAEDGGGGGGGGDDGDGDGEKLKRVKVTPLHRAAERGHIDVVRALVDELGVPANVPGRDGALPIHSAAGGGSVEVLRFLVERGAEGDATRPRPSDGSQPLHLAAFRGRAEACLYLCREAGANPEALSADGRRAVHLAALTGSVATLRALHDELGSPVDVASNNGSTPMHEATFNGHLDAMRYLVNLCGCDPRRARDNGEPPMHLAAFSGHVPAVRYLHETLGCPADEPRTDGETPLMLACYGGHLETARHLVEVAGANPRHRDNRGGSPVASAAFQGHTEVVRFLHETHGCPLDEPRNDACTPLHGAAYFHHQATLEYLLAAGADPSVMTPTGSTVLHFAVFRNNEPAARLLIAHPACSPRLWDPETVTPLHLAVRDRLVGMVRLLATEELVAAMHAPPPPTATTRGDDAGGGARNGARRAKRSLLQLCSRGVMRDGEDPTVPLLAAGVPVTHRDLADGACDDVRLWAEGRHPLQQRRAALEDALYPPDGRDVLPVRDLVTLCGRYLHAGCRTPVPVGGWE